MQYLNMIPSDPVGAYTKEGHLLGMEACEELYRNLETDLNGGNMIELRPFYLIRDHNCVMSERIKMLIGKTKAGEQLAENYARCVREYKMFLLKLIKYNISETSISKDEIVNGFRAYLYNEKIYICQFISLLQE